MAERDDEWTLERVHALPDDGNRYELLDGELLVTPAPSWHHQSVVEALFLAVKPYVTGTRALGCHAAPAAVAFSARRELQPDLFVFPLQPGQRAARFEDVGRLVLAGEVLSPSTQMSMSTSRAGTRGRPVRAHPRRGSAPGQRGREGDQGGSQERGQSSKKT